MKSVFPESITALPQADDHQILYMLFEEDIELNEHSHEDQTGFILEGRIDLVINGVKHIYTKGDRYNIPKGVKHSAYIYAGYADITVFMEPNRYKVKQ